MLKGDRFGAHRVLCPKGLLPQAAEKIDNDMNIYSNEILIEVIALQPTATAFGRIKRDSGGDIEKIKEEILSIVNCRGKFQDPVTKSGGMLIGKIKKIGEDLVGETDAEIGDKIATLVSLSLTPLKIYDITDVDLDTEQIKCNADAVLFESGIFAKLPEDIEDSLSLALMDVAGAPAQVAVNAKPGDTVVVMGAGKAGLLCLAEAKKRVKPTGRVICLEYSEEQCALVEKLGLADKVLRVNGQEPLACYRKYTEECGEDLADFTVSTVNVGDTELSAILITKDSGKIYFFSMSTDFVKASLGAEGVKKPVSMLIGNGYYPGHAEITFGIVRENPGLMQYFKKKYCG